VGGFDRPVGIAHAGDGSGRLFIVERGGAVWVARGATVLDEPFLDISDRIEASGGEQGLLGLAFPPGYEAKGHFYVNYTRAGDGATTVARYSVTADQDLADPASEEVILTVEQPFSNHNGGHLAFGPDGYLYIGLGDGGSGGDPLGNGQSTGTLLGKVLRIDVESGEAPYVIPADNPFVGVPGAREEIWALGLRNPWRFSFDRGTGDLYIGDVGQSSYEEADYQAAASLGGENYGWNIMEGAHCFGRDECDRAGLTPPVAEYAHDGVDCSVTGGYVYRGEDGTGLTGIYFFGDFCSGRIRGLRPDGASWESTVLLDSGLLISTFGEDESGELYLADYSGGGIYRVTAE
jgi:glucose/arabinose dehydrogenase